jgi:hypothetical protein
MNPYGVKFPNPARWPSWKMRRATPKAEKQEKPDHTQNPQHEWDCPDQRAFQVEFLRSRTTDQTPVGRALRMRSMVAPVVAEDGAVLGITWSRVQP